MFNRKSPPNIDLLTGRQVPPNEGHPQSYENERMWRLMEKTLGEATVEQRRRRRWSNFFRLIMVIYFGILLFNLFGDRAGKQNIPKDELGRPYTEYSAVIQLKGMIAADEDASADRLIRALTKAFKDEKVKGIIIQINSGGGSPVQSGYVYDEIKRLRGLYPHKKVYAVIADIGASGAYYIAAAADEIYADKASLVGSIGVTGASFGFVETLEKLGVERRLYTSGEHKAFLDPFQPMREDETQFWQEVLGGVHEQFINVVKEGRGERLKVAEHPDLFSGLIWNGEQALEMGLIDGLGSSSYVAREVIGAPYLVEFSAAKDPLQEFFKKLGVSFATELFTRANTPTLQ